MTDTSDAAIEALRSDVMSQVGDDVQKMFDHEALFKRAAAMLIALQAERNQLITTAEADARVEAAVLAILAEVDEIRARYAPIGSAEWSSYTRVRTAIRSRGVTG